MRSQRWVSVFAILLLAGCGALREMDAGGSAAVRPTHWSALAHVRRVVDLSAPRADGAVIVATAGRLAQLAPGGRLSAFARSYRAPGGLEPYIVLSPGLRVAAAQCGFPRDYLYALRLTHRTGVTVVDRRGRVSRFAQLPLVGLENGIAFDQTGRFGHRLLVTANISGATTLYAIDCRGHVRVLTRSGPRVEGGVAVAPAHFGRFGGDLIAPDELSGTLFAFAPNGRATVLAQSGVAHGQDVGSESLGFVPARFRDALVADRLTPGNRHPGDDLILSLSPRQLALAGVRSGDVLAVTEGGALTVAVSCRRACVVREIAVGPAVAHVEGHVVFRSAPKR